MKRGSIVLEHMDSSGTRFDRIFLLGLLGVYVLVALVLKGLTGPIDLTGSWDELTYHYPSALHLVENPFPDSLRNYPSATGPVAYLSAQVARVATMDLVAIRWLTLLVTFLLGSTIYRLLVDRCRLTRPHAAAYTVVALLSPYVLGGTFLYMTDNYAWLFVLAWVYFIAGFNEHRDIASFIKSILFLSLAICTRQTTAWIVPMTALIVWRLPDVRWKGLTLVALGCLPLVALGLLWHGPTPPSAIGRHTGIGGSYLRAATMCLTTLGFFSLFFVPWSDIAAGSKILRQKLWTPAIALAGSLALLIVAPLAGDSVGAARNPVHVDGYLLKFLDHGPRIGDAYILYLPFILAGALTLVFSAWQGRKFAVLGLLLAITIHLSNKIVYERYFELLILVFLAWTFGHKWQENRYRVLLLAALFLGHPFLRHRVSPTPFTGIDTSMYSPFRAAEVRSRFVP